MLESIRFTKSLKSLDTIYLLSKNTRLRQQPVRKVYHDEQILKSKQGGETVDQKKIDKLYELLEQAEEELDDEAVAALRWAILRLEE